MNKKKLLCNNVLKHDFCRYGDKCMYAHSLDEQNIEPIRVPIFNYIKGITNVLDINNQLIYQELLQLTKVCDNCSAQSCSGGLNCKYGAVSNEYCICYNDLVHKVCTNGICNKVHLSKFNKNHITPEYIPMEPVEIPEYIILNNEYFDENESQSSIEELQNVDNDEFTESIFD